MPILMVFSMISLAISLLNFYAGGDYLFQKPLKPEDFGNSGDIYVIPFVHIVLFTIFLILLMRMITMMRRLKNYEKRGWETLFRFHIYTTILIVVPILTGVLMLSQEKDNLVVGILTISILTIPLIVTIYTIWKIRPTFSPSTGQSHSAGTGFQSSQSVKLEKSGFYFLIVSKSKKFKLLLVTISIILIGFLAWNMYFSNLVITKFSNNYFEISIPMSYTLNSRDRHPSLHFSRNDLFGQSISTVDVGSGDIPFKTRPEMEAEYSTLFTEEHKSEIIKSFAGSSILTTEIYNSSDVVIRNYNKDDISIYSAAGKYTFGEISGYFSGAYFVGDNNHGNVYVASRDGFDILQEASKMIDSYKYK